MQSGQEKTELARRTGLVLWSLLLAAFVLKILMLVFHQEQIEKPVPIMEVIRLVLITFSLALIVYAYSIRTQPKVKAVGWKERILPMFVALLGFGFFQFETPPPDVSIYALGTLICILGWGFTLWAFAYLKGSFSILAEVRELIQEGPYGWVRHPLYAGEMVNWIGLAILFTGWPVKIYAAALIALQVWRARVEERKLEAAFGQVYTDYKSKTGFLLPWL